jgi:hypothetical protein
VGRRVLLELSALVLAVPPAVGLNLTGGPAAAAQFDVTSNADSGAGSLRDAVAAAAAAAGNDDVVIAPGLDTITLASTIDYPVTADGALTIVGNGATIAGGAFIFLNNASTNAVAVDGVTLSKAGGGNALNGAGGELTLTNSTVTRDAPGGDIVNTSSGDVTVRSSSITNGGVNTSTGTMTIESSTVSGDTGDVLNSGSGTQNIVNSLISGGGSDGINTASGTLNITGTTVTENADGGVNSSFAPGAINITNSTVAGNASTGISGTASAVTLVYSTIVDNGDGAGDPNVDALQLTSFGSVVALVREGADNCNVVTTTTNGFNYTDDDTCLFTGTGDVENGSDPLLGALGDNGGPTPTRLPLTGSPLLDRIPAASCQADGAAGVTTDQRGVTRPQSSGCDIGAVEVEVAAPQPPPAAPPTPVTAVVRFTG